jgi:hypothetical protein
MKLALIAALAAPLALAACRSNRPVVVERRSEPSTVVVEKDHSHHYYYDGHWYAEPEHIHIVD